LKGHLQCQVSTVRLSVGFKKRRRALHGTKLRHIVDSGYKEPDVSQVGKGFGANISHTLTIHVIGRLLVGFWDINK